MENKKTEQINCLQDNLSVIRKIAGWTAEELGEKIGEMFPECDVEVHFGGQPIYYYVVSVE